MKQGNNRLSAKVGKHAKKRLAELQAELRFMGFSDRDTSPGKIVAALLLSRDALQSLKKEYSFTE